MAAGLNICAASRLARGLGRSTSGLFGRYVNILAFFKAILVFALNMGRGRKLGALLGEEGHALINAAIALREVARLCHSKDKGHITEVAHVVVELAVHVRAGSRGALGDNFVPVHTCKRRGSKVVLAGPKQCLGRKDDHILRGMRILHERTHVEVGHNHTQKVHAVIKR